MIPTSFSFRYLWCCGPPLSLNKKFGKKEFLHLITSHSTKDLILTGFSLDRINELQSASGWIVRLFKQFVGISQMITLICSQEELDRPKET